MNTEIQFQPEQASTLAPRVDALYYYLTGVSVFMTLLIATLIVFFAIRYRRGNKVDRSPLDLRYQKWMEVIWIAVPLVIVLSFFGWGAWLYLEQARPPLGALEIQVTGKQWMWKFQHPQGNSEINDLHVPVGRPIKLTMISEDVIHSMYFPAFRVKHDVLPGRYTGLWFEATRTGQYHLFCAEYCGAGHAVMKGTVTVMEPSDYEAWLSGRVPDQTPVEAGKALFEEMRCASCHQGGGTQGRGPSLVNLFGKEVRLKDGRTVIANEEYLRESILTPAAKVVVGYEPIMPTFQGQISEEGVRDLIAYIKSLAESAPTGEEP